MSLLISRTAKRVVAAAVILGAVAFAAASGPAAAAPKETLFLKYYLRVAGLRVATLRFEIEITKQGYQVQSSMKTKGLLNFISSNKFSASSVGTLKRFTPVPSRYDMETESSSKGKRKHSIVWNANRVPTTTRSWQLGDYKTASLKKTVRANMPDPLTALLAASFQNSDGLCQAKFRVYDGKTVYDLVYSYLKRDDFDADDRGVYRGEAHQCQISYRPVAGLSVKKWQKLERKRNKGRETFVLWMAPVMATNINRTVYVPVGGAARMDGRLTYAHLVSAALSGRPLNELSVMAEK